MAETFRRTKLERVIRQLEAQLIDIESCKGEENEHGMGLYYEGQMVSHRQIISMIKREFKLEQMKKEKGK